MENTHLARYNATFNSNSMYMLSTEYPSSVSPAAEHTSELVYTTNWVNQYTLVPVIGIVGILGNIFSGIVVVKSGLRRPSNILLLGLAIGDTLTLLDVFDVSEYIYLANRNCSDECNVLIFPYKPALTILVFEVAFFAISAFGARMSTTVTVIITIERLIAVFYPLKLSQLMTRHRACLAVIGAVLFWLPWTIFQCFWFKFNFKYSHHYKSFIAWYSKSEYLNNDNFNVPDFNDLIVTHLTHTIPLIFVAVGSTAIGIKVSIASKIRRELASATPTRKLVSRTTLTLLMVCVIFSITKFCFVLRNLPWFNFDEPAWVMISLFYGAVRERLLEINSACNFFIYVAFNPRFRHILKDVFLNRPPEVKSVSSY